jgi:hypothetical protein
LISGDDAVTTYYPLPFLIPRDIDETMDSEPVRGDVTISKYNTKTVVFKSKCHATQVPQRVAIVTGKFEGTSTTIYYPHPNPFSEIEPGVEDGEVYSESEPESKRGSDSESDGDTTDTWSFVETPTTHHIRLMTKPYRKQSSSNPSPRKSARASNPSVLP